MALGNAPMASYFDTISCTPTADPGYTFDQAADTDPAGKATVACTATECTISDVTDNIKVNRSDVIDTQFKYSDHNPVDMTFVLK